MNQRNKPTICVVGGKGRMGQWFHNLFAEHSLAVSLVGKEPRPDDMVKAVADADIVVIAVPIAATREVIESVIPHLRKDAVLTDITSLKVMPLQAMQKAPCAVIGMHPLFGPSAISPQGQKIVLCHSDKTKKQGQQHIGFLRQLFEASGMEIIEMDAEEHDKQMARIQALTHSVNILLAKTLNEQKISLDPRLLTPIFTLQSLTEIRVLQQQPELMADIQLLNPYFLPVLESLLQQTQKLFAINKTKNRKELIDSLESVRQQTKDLAPYALRQTNKMLQMVQERSAPTQITEPKISHKRHLRVAFLGPEGTNTHQAALQIEDENELIAQINFNDIFAVVLSGKADVGVVPAENSLQGTIRETLDLLSDSPLQVIGAFDLPIHHCLLSLEKDLNKIQVVISHPQALAQCKHWLAANLPKAHQVVSTSTTAALRVPKKGEAYIAAEGASKIYHVPILAQDIEDQSNNTTRFYVIAKQLFELPGLHKNYTLLFLTVYNRVGILRDILEVFADADINLVKLESRPSLEKIWDYCFYIEVDQQAESKRMGNTLQKLEQYCNTVRVLGRT